jgi:hypothetical protein
MISSLDWSPLVWLAHTQLRPIDVPLIAAIAGCW